MGQCKLAPPTMTSKQYGVHMISLAPGKPICIIDQGRGGTCIATPCNVFMPQAATKPPPLQTLLNRRCLLPNLAIFSPAIGSMLYMESNSLLLAYDGREGELFEARFFVKEPKLLPSYLEENRDSIWTYLSSFRTPNAPCILNGNFSRIADPSGTFYPVDKMTKEIGIELLPADMQALNLESDIVYTKKAAKKASKKRAGSAKKGARKAAAKKGARKAAEADESDGLSVTYDDPAPVRVERSDDHESEEPVDSDDDEAKDLQESLSQTYGDDPPQRKRSLSGSAVPSASAIWGPNGQIFRVPYSASDMP